MAKNTKVLTVLSTAAVTGLITAALGSTAFAKTSAILVQNGSNDYKYDYSSLASAFEDYSANPSNGALYQDYLKQLGGKSPVALYDDVQKTYIDYTKVASAFEDAQATTKPFNLNAFTEASKDTYTPAAPISDATVGSDGKVIYTREDTGLSVSSVSALNARQIKITFAHAVDASTLTSDNLKVYIGTNTTETAWTKTLSADGLTLTLGLGDSIPQDTDVKVTINGVANKDNAKDVITNYSVTKHMIDTTAPTINGAIATTSKTFKLYTTSPVQLESGASDFHVLTNITVDGNKLVGKLTQDYSTNEVNVELGSSLSVGDHKIVVSGYKGFNGFNAPSYEGTITVKEDKTAPKVIGVETLSKSKIKVTFSEPVQALGTITIGNDTHPWTVANPSTDVSADKTQYTLTTTGNVLDLGSVVQAKLFYVGTTDMEGNAVQASDKAEFDFTSKDDTTAPTATISVDKSNDIVITYSKEMSKLGTVTIKDKDGKTIFSGLTPTLVDATKNQYKIDATVTGFDKSVTAAAYTVTLTGGVDNSLRQNSLADTAAAITVVDNVAPTLDKALLTQGQTTKADGVTVDKYAQVTLYFSEPMDASTLSNLANYTVVVKSGDSAKQLSTVDNAAASVAADGKSVVLTIPGATAGVTTVSPLSLKDAAGNLINGLNVASKVQDPGKDLTALALDSTFGVQETAANQIKVKFSNPMSVIDPSEFTVIDNSDPAKPVTELVGVSSTLDTDNQTATITLSGNLNGDATYGTAKTNVILSVKSGDQKNTFTNTKDIYGTHFVTATTATIADKVAPSLSNVKINGNTITLKNDGTDVIDLTKDVDLSTTSVTLSEDATVTFTVDGTTETAKLNAGNIDGNNATIKLLDKNGDGKVSADELSHVGNTVTITDGKNTTRYILLTKTN